MSDNNVLKDLINNTNSNNENLNFEKYNKIQRFSERRSLSKIEKAKLAISKSKYIEDNISYKVLSKTPAFNAIMENNKIEQALLRNNPSFETLKKDIVLDSYGDLTAKLAIPDYHFQTPEFVNLENLSKSVIKSFAIGLEALVSSSFIQEIQSVTSNFAKWLQTIDFSPLLNIIETVNSLGFRYNYDEVNEVYLKAMFDAKWFPYAGWIADFSIAEEIFDILNTSRVSKNRIKRIDKLIFSYYSKDKMNNLKRGWRQMSIPSYIIRILVQSVQAYYRREYALTVSALSTLWEGIIQNKINDNSYRISRKSRENLTKLIYENNFDKIFASFCDEFIFYDCKSPEEFKEDVPGRHGIAHSWYNTYPSRKMALNAILFTDFLLRLTPLEKSEDENNG